jgi:hypothetical protein
VGRLTYDSIHHVDLDDRTLAHVQLVIAAKLRRNEAFFMSWHDDSSVGGGRTAVWMHPNIPVGFKFYGGRPPAINRAWVEALMDAANSGSGLRIIPEPDEPKS